MKESKMSYIMVDIEADGPIPGDYSMISFAAIVVDPEMDKTFSARLKPISETYIPEVLQITGFSREETKNFNEPQKVMLDFKAWILNNSAGRPMFISDNNGFDWMFMCWYFHHFIHENPFGHSSTNLGSLYKGIVKNMHQSFKHLRKTRHSHDPLDDARGNVEAFLQMIKQYNLKAGI
jgi:hypothetical protein